jgi:hypothetical protein
MPEIMVKTPMPTPNAIEIWYGLMRFAPAAGAVGVSCVVLMKNPR